VLVGLVGLVGRRDALSRIGRIGRIGRIEGLARLPVGIHGAGRYAPGTWHPLRQLRSALALEFARAKHLAYARRGDPE
jgi:hypothetical protein